MNQPHHEYTVYVGTYTRSEPHVVGQADGIYVYRLNGESGEMRQVSAMAGIENPSFLALDPQRRYLYATSEIGDYEGQATGAVYAYAIDPDDGSLSALNQRPSHGTAPCHLTVDADSRYVMVANYSGGSLAIYPIEQDGSLGEATQVIQHEGGSVNPQRQEGPHVHSVNLDGADRRLFAPDLGLDKIMIYALDKESGTLEPAPQPWVEAAPGAGPRHFVFHPSQEYAYLIQELNSTITVYAYAADEGRLTALQTVSTLPDDFSGDSSTADIHVSSDGRFVYGSNRGHDSIAIFAVDGESGQLTSLGHVSTLGRTPRNFALDPTGDMLLAANQDSNTIVSYFVEQESGQLKATGHIIPVPSPVCVKIVKIGAS